MTALKRLLPLGMALVTIAFAAATGTEETSRTEEPLRLTMLLAIHESWPYQEDWPMWEWIEEEMNVEFDVQTSSWGAMVEAINLNVAAGSMPDLTYFTQLRDAKKFGQDGVLANILDYTDQMPNFSNWMGRYPGVVETFVAADGGLYMYPNEGFGEANRIIWMYRDDIFEQHGLSTPHTYDELYEVAKTLKGIYPESYPFTIWGGLIHMLLWTTPQFDTTSPYWYDGNGFYRDSAGVVQYGPATDNFKELLRHFNRFHEEDLMPPDWLTLSQPQYQNMVATDNTFITVDFLAMIGVLLPPLQQENPSFSMRFAPPPAGIPGSDRNIYFHILKQGLSVSSQSDHVPQIMQAYDWFYSEDARQLVSWGRDDALFVDGDDGSRIINPTYPDVSAVRAQTGWSTNGAYIWYDFNAWLVPSVPEMADAYQKAWDGGYAEEPRTPPRLTAEEQRDSVVTLEAILKHAEANIVKFITGDRSLSEWSAYVGELNDLGLDDMIALAERAYRRTDAQ